MSIIERAAGKLGQPDSPATTIHANRSPASREESGRLIEAAIERAEASFAEPTTQARQPVYPALDDR
jgi:hypothetical protein